MNQISFSPLGDRAIILDFGPDISLEMNKKILAMRSLIEDNAFPGLVEIAPAYTTLTVFYDPTVIGPPFPYEFVEKLLKRIIHQPMTAVKNKVNKIEIPVCYDQQFAWDLPEVALHNDLSTKQVVELHHQRKYDVYFLGFSPGFPFLGGMDERIAAPRRSSPRLKIPKGAVGIAGHQTGIYPLETPGGWQIIGRTPLPLFDISKEKPTLLQPGDSVHFQPISLEEFFSLEAEACRSK